MAPAMRGSLCLRRTNVTESQIVALVARSIKEHGFVTSRPMTPERLATELAKKPIDIMNGEWAHHVPLGITARWDQLPDAFKLGVLVVAAGDPMGVTAGAGYQND